MKIGKFNFQRLAISNSKLFIPKSKMILKSKTSIIFVGKPNPTDETLGLDLAQIEQLVKLLSENGIAVKLTVAELNNLPPDDNIVQAVHEFEMNNPGKEDMGFIILDKKLI